MNIVVLTDIHGRRQQLERLQTELTEADLVVIAGDIGLFRELESALAVVDYIHGIARQVLAVGGNCDPPTLEGELAARKLSLHGLVHEIDGIQFAGLGGSLPCPGTTPREYSEDELELFLNACRDQLQPGPHVLVSHQPPIRTRADLAGIGRHVGSHAVRAYIEATRPVACLCGHIHEGRGRDRIGDSVIINPGDFAAGRYARVKIRETCVQVDFVRL